MKTILRFFGSTPATEVIPPLPPSLRVAAGQWFQMEKTRQNWNNKFGKLYLPAHFDQFLIKADAITGYGNNTKVLKSTWNIREITSTEYICFWRILVIWNLCAPPLSDGTVLYKPAAGLQNRLTSHYFTNIGKSWLIVYIRRTNFS